MNTLKVQIAKVGNAYNAMIDGVDSILVSGESLSQIKENLLSAIELQKEMSDAVPSGLAEDYKIEYYLNMESFLEFYSHVFTKSGLEYLTGINQKQLWHYASGKRKPRKRQRERFEAAIHRLGEELISFHL